MNNEIKQGYKVVRLDDDEKMFSCFAGQNFIKGEVKYCFGEWTEPLNRCGALAIFARKRSAENFIGMNSGLSATWRIIPCDYMESRIKRLFTLRRCAVDYAIPPETIFASKVMLIKGM